MKSLQLPLKKQWFELTKQGIKTEDYRELTQYWFVRLVFDYKKVFNYYTSLQWDDDHLRDEGIAYIAKSKNKYFGFNPYNQNIMSLGYPKLSDNNKIIKLEHIGIEINTGKPEWGAVPGQLYFVIKHGAITP